MLLRRKDSLVLRKKQFDVGYIPPLDSIFVGLQIVDHLILIIAFQTIL